jgi:O-antigen/teichoic acid export membrane protein
MVTAIVAAAIGLAAMRSCCLDVIFMIAKRTRMQSLIMVIAALINVALNYATIPQWGGVGAAISTLAAFAFAFFASLALGWRILPMRICAGDLVRITMSALLMGLALMALPRSGQIWIDLLLKITIGVAAYLGALLITNPASLRRRILHP